MDDMCLLETPNGIDQQCGVAMAVCLLATPKIINRTSLSQGGKNKCNPPFHVFQPIKQKQ
jgi:hypothetical protein